MSSNFLNSFIREFGKNSGKFISNKIFGRSWSTPHSHEISMQKNEDSSTPEKNPTINEGLNENAEFTDSSTQSNDGNTDQNQQGINTTANHESDNNLETLIQSTKTPLGKNTIILVFSVLIVCIISLVLISHNSELSKKRDFDKHNQLEYFEGLIRLKIKDGNKSKALFFIHKLNHPSDAIMPNDGSLKKFFSTNPSYKYYWMQKKKLYMNRILD